LIVPKSVLEAIKLGLWDFEPQDVDPKEYDAADAMPGTKEKLLVMADRLQRGLPLWHKADREDLDAPHPSPRRDLE
jgi:hypothetical protein